MFFDLTARRLWNENVYGNGDYISLEVAMQDKYGVLFRVFELTIKGHQLNGWCEVQDDNVSRKRFWGLLISGCFFVMLF